jgi:hypothetical protein
VLRHASRECRRGALDEPRGRVHLSRHRPAS